MSKGDFGREKGCMDQVFASKIMVEKYMGKDRKLYAAFLDMEKAYERVDRKGLWDILRT